MSGYLRRRNPVAKIAAALWLSLALVLVIDPATPLLFIALVVAAGIALGGIAPASYTRAVLPLLLVAVGFVWSNALFAASPGDEALVWGPMRVSPNGLLFGVAIGLRGLAIGLVSLTFVRCTDPTDLTVSLIRWVRVPPSIAYAMLAALRFLPFFAQEYAQIRLAQRVRGVRRSPVRGLVALFAQATRRATRIAIAMDARGFGSGRQRSYFRVVPLTIADAAFVALTVAVTFALFVLSGSAGWLRIWDGRFSA